MREAQASGALPPPRPADAPQAGSPFVCLGHQIPQGLPAFAAGFSGLESYLMFTGKKHLLPAGPIKVLLQMNTLLRQRHEGKCSSSSEAIWEGKQSARHKGGAFEALQAPVRLTPHFLSKGIKGSRIFI